ncbi:4787_t:CDS:2, partial [Cetraspora pellucida]
KHNPYKEKVKELETKIHEQYKTIEDLKKQVKNKENNQEPKFTCYNCQKEQAISLLVLKIPDKGPLYLEQIIYEYIPATDTTEELKKTLASGGYGLLASPIAKHYFDRYQYRTFEPHEDVFVATFKTNVINVIVEVRKKEYFKNYDNTKIDTGNVKNIGSNNQQTNEQKQINSQSVPIFSNVDLTSGQFGGFQRQQQLANKQTEQGQNIQSGNFNKTTSRQNLTSKEYYRQNKDANVSITKQDAYELNSRLRILLKKTEKEYKKLPDTSNRKPRIALRLQIAEGATKAYGKEDLNLPSVQEFRARVNGEVEGYQKVIGDKPEQLMICLLGPPGLGKSYISQSLAKALNRGFHIISMNGKQSASIIYGTDISNPGAEAGEIVKAISKREDRACVIFFDELEKAGKDAKRAVGNPTDRTVNKDFKDDFFDFPTPLNEIIYLVAINYPEDLPDFVRDRFRVIEVPPLPYEQRLEVVRLVLRGKLKPLNNAFQTIYGKKELDKGDADRKRPPCPYASDRNKEHRENCECFMANLDKQGIYPLLNNLGGDKTLAFRCDRLLKNKIIGESSSLFNDLLICELEYRQMLKFKDLLGELADNLINQTNLDNQQQENILADIKKLREGKINQAICSENITDGKPFFQLGAIKEDSERGLAVATQNRKGFGLNNPYLGVVNFHQKHFRFYRVKGLQQITNRELIRELETRIKNQQIKGEEMFWLLEIRKKQRLAEYEAATNDPDENEELED